MIQRGRLMKASYQMSNSSSKPTINRQNTGLRTSNLCAGAQHVDQKLGSSSVCPQPNWSYQYYRLE